VTLRGLEAAGRLRGGADPLSFRSTGRFLLLLSILFAGHVLVGSGIAFGAVAPDFYLMAVVFGALRWGPVWGAALGFLLGLNVDAMRIDDFGASGLAFTIVGFLLGKMKQSLYLDLPALDVILLFASGVLAGGLVTLVGSDLRFALFEQRFFYEVPFGALYTAALGGLLFRALRD
jgi:rod shape-determining protein MreD